MDVYLLDIGHHHCPPAVAGDECLNHMDGCYAPGWETGRRDVAVRCYRSCAFWVKVTEMRKRTCDDENPESGAEEMSDSPGMNGETVRMIVTAATGRDAQQAS